MPYESCSLNFFIILSKGKLTTLHRQNTTTIESCVQLKPNPQEAVQLFALLLEERIDLNACTLRNNQPCSNEKLEKH